MVSRLLSLAVIICTAVSVNADVITANDAQTCEDLCTSCHGTASFVDGRCECYISDVNEQDAECILRIKRQADQLGLDLVDCEPATPERHARCHLGAGRRLRTHDAHRIANYFMNGGPLTGTPMVGAPPCETDKIIGSSNPQSQPQLMPLKLEAVESKQPTPSEPITGASNPSSECLGAPLVQPSHSMNTPAYYRTPETLVGSPTPHYPIQSSYGYGHTLLPTALHPHTLGIPHVWSPTPLAGPTHSPLISLIGPHHYHHRIPHIAIPRTNFLGAAHKQASSSQITEERPQMLASAGPIIQPEYTYSPVVGASAPLQEILPLLRQALVEQNAILESISHQLDNHAATVGIPRVFYPPSEPKVGASTPKAREDCDCSGEKPSAPVVASAQRKNDCDDSIMSMTTPKSGKIVASAKQRPPRMSEDVEKQAENVEMMEAVEVIPEKPKREARPDANGRKRKRELKKIVETKSR